MAQDPLAESEGEDPAQFRSGVPPTCDQPGQHRNADEGQAKHKLLGRGCRGAGEASGLQGAMGGGERESSQPSRLTRKEQSRNGSFDMIQVHHTKDVG